jgi:hypothetical protein
MPVTSYSTTPGSNNSAAPNGAPEGWAPSAVNDTIRQIMTDIAVEAQKNAVKVLASVAGTNTVTGSMTPDLTAYSAGMLVVLTPANTNTGATTLNIDSLGALDVQKYSGEALAAGDLVVGVPALLVLDTGADDFILLNPQSNTITNGALTVQHATTASLILRDSDAATDEKGWRQRSSAGVWELATLDDSGTGIAAAIKQPEPLTASTCKQRQCR